MSNQTFEPIVITDSNYAEILALIEELKTKLPVGLINLTPSDKQDMPKSADKTDAFNVKSYDYGILLAPLIPATVNVDNMKKHTTGIERMMFIKRSLDGISAKLDDTCVKSRSEIYKSALAIYIAIKAGIRSQVDGAKEAYAELKKRFPGHKTKVVPPPDNTNENTDNSSTNTPVDPA